MGKERSVRKSFGYGVQTVRVAVPVESGELPLSGTASHSFSVRPPLAFAEAEGDWEPRHIL